MRTMLRLAVALTAIALSGCRPEHDCAPRAYDEGGSNEGAQFCQSTWCLCGRGVTGVQTCRAEGWDECYCEELNPVQPPARTCDVADGT